MPTGQSTLSLLYSSQHVDRNIQPFHRELLTAWLTHSPHHTRINRPATLSDVLQELLFRNLLITVQGLHIYHSDWVKTGVLRVKDLCYNAIPGFLPVLAIHEVLMLTQNDPDCTRSLLHASSTASYTPFYLIGYISSIVLSLHNRVHFNLISPPRHL